MLILLLLLAFFIGSIPTAWLVVKAVKNVDIRDYGSGNVGATNAFRVVGKKWGSFVLFFDILKGAIPVLIAKRLFQYGGEADYLIGLMVGIFAIFGHNWSPFMKFKGGKGVATSLGVVLALFPKAGACALATFFIFFLPTGYISLGSITGAVAFPLFQTLFYHSITNFPILLLLGVILMLSIVIRHKSNIQRLLNGNENCVWKK